MQPYIRFANAQVTSAYVLQVGSLEEGGGGEEIGVDTQRSLDASWCKAIVTAERWNGRQQASCPGDLRMLASGRCLSREVIVQDQNQSRLFSAQGRGKPFLHSTQSIPATKG